MLRDNPPAGVFDGGETNGARARSCRDYFDRSRLLARSILAGFTELLGGFEPSYIFFPAFGENMPVCLQLTGEDFSGIIPFSPNRSRPARQTYGQLRIRKHPLQLMRAHGCVAWDKEQS